MAATVLNEWQKHVAGDKVVAPKGMVRALKFIPGSGVAYLRDFRSVDEAIRIISLANDDLRTRAHLFGEDGHLLRHEFNPFTATVAADWRDCSSMWPKAPRGMFRLVLSSTDHSRSIERDFPKLDEALESAHAVLTGAWDEATIYDDEGGETDCLVPASLESPF